MPKLEGDYARLTIWISKNYHGARKIVEVGVGSFPSVAASIKKRLPNVDVVVTDIDGEKLNAIRKGYPELKLRAEMDNIITPRLEVYLGSSLIYSLKTPPELVPYVVKVAKIVGADTLIRPLSGEEAGFDFSGWRFLPSTRSYLLPAT